MIMKKDHYLKIVTEYLPDYLETAPKTFDNDADGHAKLCLNDMWGSLYFEGREDEKPVMFFRHSNPASYRFGGIVELGDDPFSPQKGGYHHDDLAQKDTKTTAYEKLSDDPLTYGISSKEPFSAYRFYTDHAEFKEGSVLELKATPFPITIEDHGTMYPPLVQFAQPCLLEGVYEGKKVHGIGSYDRCYMPQTITHAFGENLGYVSSMGSGIREDGRKELCIACKDHKGISVGVYWLEGEEPVISYDVEMEAEWRHLPYCDDGTCGYESAVYRFADIEFHMEGKWGTKGFTKHPRIERHGQSQVFGTWYVGKTPYKHVLSNSFNENMEAYDYKLKELGYTVKED